MNFKLIFNVLYWNFYKALTELFNPSSDMDNNIQCGCGFRFWGRGGGGVNRHGNRTN